jgi:hypothetical protein
VRGVPQLVRWVNKFAIIAAFVLGALGARGVERRRRRCLVVLSVLECKRGHVAEMRGDDHSGSLPRAQPILIEQDRVSDVLRAGAFLACAAATNKASQGVKPRRS